MTQDIYLVYEIFILNNERVIAAFVNKWDALDLATQIDRKYYFRKSRIERVKLYDNSQTMEKP